jgi:hypothetical protein
VADLFISYAHSDGDEAKQLVSALRAVNVVGWLDSADIAAGTAVASAVRDALKKSSAVVVLLSPGALHSEWVQFEIGAAEALSKKIIPVIVAGEHLEDQLPDILKGRAWIDARDRPSSEVVKELQQALASTK